MNKRMIMAAFAAVLLSLSFSTVAYAGGGDSEDTAEQPPIVVETTPIEEPPAEKPFTPDGTGTVIDNSTDEEGKEFFTIMTPSENVFYLVIDRQRSTENVYFLGAVTEKDLLALAEISEEPAPTPAPVEPEPPIEEETPEEQPAKKSNTGLLIIVLLLAGVGGGAAYYFKVMRPKQQGQPEEDLDEAEYTEEDDSPPWDVEDEDTEESSR